MVGRGDGVLLYQENLSTINVFYCVLCVSPQESPNASENTSKTRLEASSWASTRVVNEAKGVRSPPWAFAGGVRGDTAEKKGRGDQGYGGGVTFSSLVFSRPEPLGQATTLRVVACGRVLIFAIYAPTWYCFLLLRQQHNLCSSL